MRAAIAPTRNNVARASIHLAGSLTDDYFWHHCITRTTTTKIRNFPLQHYVIAGHAIKFPHKNRSRRRRRIPTNITSTRSSVNFACTSDDAPLTDDYFTGLSRQGIGSIASTEILKLTVKYHIISTSTIALPHFHFSKRLRYRQKIISTEILTRNIATRTDYNPTDDSFT